MRGKIPEGCYFEAAGMTGLSIIGFENKPAIGEYVGNKINHVSFWD